MFTFQGISWSSNDTLKVSLSWARQYTSTSKPPFHKKPISNGISHLASNQVQLNIDGSVRFEEGFVAIGGLVSDHNEGWIIGFGRYLGNCTIPEAELWGVLDGLKLITNCSFDRVLTQFDCLEVVNAIQEGSSSDSTSTQVRRFHQLLQRINHQRIQHISREENLLVDSLVKLVRERRTELRLYEDPHLKELV